MPVECDLRVSWVVQMIDGVVRSLLFVLAYRHDRVLKAVGLPADGIIIDLEDAVLAGDKEAARESFGGLIEDLETGGRLLAVRLNPLSTVDGLKDLLAVLGWKRSPDASVMAKVETPGEVELAGRVFSPSSPFGPSGMLRNWPAQVRV